MTLCMSSIELAMFDVFEFTEPIYNVMRLKLNSDVLLKVTFSKSS